MSPLISIVIATRNAADMLPRCLDSLRRQRFRDFEVIVVDGASTDGTQTLLAAARDTVACWRSEPDTGIYNAWNKGLRLARGEWIGFLGADDHLWDDSALQHLAPALRGALPAHRVVYGRLRQVDRSGRVVEELGRPWEEERGPFRSYRCLPHPGLMHHRSLFEERGPFDESFEMAGDYELLLRELKERDALYVPVAVAGMRLGGRTSSPEHFLRLHEETRRALAMHGLRPPRLRFAYENACARTYLWLQRRLGERLARRAADAYRLLTLRGARYSRRD